MNQESFTHGTLCSIINDDVIYSTHQELINKLDLKIKNKDDSTTSYLVDSSNPLFVNTFNTKTHKIELCEVTEILERKSIAYLHSVVHNNIQQLVSNILTYNLKNQSYDYSTPDDINNRYVVQTKTLPETYNPLTQIDGVYLTFDTGFLLGYWLLRGGFYRLPQQNTETPSWSGRDKDIEIIKSALAGDQTSIVIKVKEKTTLIAILDPRLEHLIRTHFIANNKKTIPNWLFRCDYEFSLGFFFGLILSNSYLSQDKKNNHYLAIKITKDINRTISQFILAKLGIYSKIISESRNFISFKITHGLSEILSIGLSRRKIYFQDDFQLSGLNIPKNKEIWVKQSFRATPWYKFKVNQFPIKLNEEVSYGLVLKNANNYMLSNGIFVKSS